jgi:hypothetical protein
MELLVRKDSEGSSTVLDSDTTDTSHNLKTEASSWTEGPVLLVVRGKAVKYDVGTMYSSRALPTTTTTVRLGDGNLNSDFQ